MPVPEQDERSIASFVEAHEAEVWARCIELAAAMPGDPLGAVVDRSGPVPLPALTAVDSCSFNRVVGLGVEEAATREEIERIASHYHRLGQRNFRIELAPVASPPETTRWLENVGLHPVEGGMTKVWRPLGGLGSDHPGASAGGPGVSGGSEQADGAEHCEVRVLDEADATAVSALNVRAWGAWQAGVSLGPWFAAPVGAEGFAHYGAFVDGRLVCTGALAVHGRLAWIGFDATHPRHRSRQLRRALTRRRLSDALAAGCTVAHAEGRTDRLTGRFRMLDTLYVRRFLDHVDGPSGDREAGASPAGTEPR